MSKPLRRHQIAIERRAQKVALAGNEEKFTTEDITPGGGKSLGVSLFARALLDKGYITRVVWIVPRKSLAEQAAASFQDVDWNPGFALRVADNRAPFFRDVALGKIGYTTTYAAVLAQPEAHQQAFDQAPGKVLLVLDELHHLSLNDEGEAQDRAEQRAWTQAIAPLVQRARHVLVMSGTLERWDRAPVPFIEYTMNDADQRVPVRHIRYTRRDALSEKAILPINFRYTDGLATYQYRGVDQSQDIATADPAEYSRVLRTALNDQDFREGIIREGLVDWMTFRENNQYDSSRAIIICGDQETARETERFVREEFNVTTALAISDESKAAEVLRRFREGKGGEVLITVGMAYEGLDAPSATHLICLTHVRSTPWLDQAFNRVTRVDYKCGLPYEDQQAFIYVPHDQEMQSIVTAIREDQDRGIREREDDNGDDDGDDENRSGPSNTISSFRPISAESTGVRYGSLEEGEANREDSALIEQYRADFPEVRSLPATTLLNVLRRAAQSSRSCMEGMTAWAAGTTGGPAIQVRPQVLDPMEEKNLREQLQTKARRVDRSRGWEPGTANKCVVEKFNKRRSEMGVQELRLVVAFLNELIHPKPGPVEP